MSTEIMSTKPSEVGHLDYFFLGDIMLQPQIIHKMTFCQPAFKTGRLEHEGSGQNQRD